MRNHYQSKKADEHKTEPHEEMAALEEACSYKQMNYVDFELGIKRISVVVQFRSKQRVHSKYKKRLP